LAAFVLPKVVGLWSLWERLLLAYYGDYFSITSYVLEAFLVLKVDYFRSDFSYIFGSSFYSTFLTYS